MNPEPLPPVKSETIAWLQERLASGSSRIASLIAEWCGGQQVRQPNGTLQWESGQDGKNGRYISDLMAARQILGVEAYVDDHDRYCWRLPRKSVH